MRMLKGTHSMCMHHKACTIFDVDCCVGCSGAKADPTRIRVVDIHESSSDPLARAVRHRMKRKHGIAEGIPILLSTEKPLAKLVDVPVEGANPADYQVMQASLSYTMTCLHGAVVKIMSAICPETVLWDSACFQVDSVSHIVCFSCVSQFCSFLRPTNAA